MGAPSASALPVRGPKPWPSPPRVKKFLSDECKDCKAACMGGGHGPDPRVGLLDKVVAGTKLLDVLETTL